MKQKKYLKISQMNMEDKDNNVNCGLNHVILFFSVECTRWLTEVQ
jgi:hypothetical protein